MCVSFGNQTKTGTFLDVSEIGTRRMARTAFTRNPRAAEKWRENHGAYIMHYNFSYLFKIVESLTRSLSGEKIQAVLYTHLFFY
jgi:hypothetical protein